MEGELGKILTTQNIVQGGGTLVALFLAGILYKFVSNHSHNTDKVIEKNADSNKDLAISIERHSGVIERLSETIERKIP